HAPAHAARAAAVPGPAPRPGRVDRRDVPARRGLALLPRPGRAAADPVVGQRAAGRALAAAAAAVGGGRPRLAAGRGDARPAGARRRCTRPAGPAEPLRIAAARRRAGGRHPRTPRGPAEPRPGYTPRTRPIVRR